MTNSEFLSISKMLSVLNMSLEGHPYDEAIDALEEKILTNQYKIAVVGDFSTGKSTFINAVLGDDLLYSSTKEATGVITTIQYGDRAYAQVCQNIEDVNTRRVMEEIDLADEDGKLRLNTYLDIESKRDVGQVDIYYPISGMSSDVVFFDTPGIEKLSQKPMLMTKKIIAQSNAIIFLITKKGFTEKALKVIAGEHEVIGKISAKDIMVVMTHIGEIYDDNNDEDAKNKIERITKEVKEQLSEKGLGYVEVFPVDSRDYLWGSNREIYIREKKERNVVLNGEMLSQEEYKKRSGFDEFRESLQNFLDSDNLMKCREEDIKNCILLITEAMEKEIQEQAIRGKQNDESMLAELERQMELACSNQRKFFNRLVRRLHAHMEGFLENVERDIKDKNKDSMDVLDLIQETFQDLKDINKKNVQKCVNAVVAEIDIFARKIEEETNNHIKITRNSFVKDVFSEEFQKIFDKKVSVEMQKTESDFRLILQKDDYDVESVVNDEALRRMEKDKQEVKIDIRVLENKLDLIANSNDKSVELKKRKEELERWYEAETLKLGSRPKAVQKYRTETRSKGILFWKKTWKVEVPDGLDNSQGLVWDSKQKSLLHRYEKELETIYLLERKAEMEAKDRRKLENKLLERKKRLKHLEDALQKYQELMRQEKENYTDEYISGKKENVAIECDRIRGELLEQVDETVRRHVYDCKKAMEAGIKAEVELQMEKYEEDLKEKNKVLCEKVKVSEETRREMLSNLSEIKEKVRYGQAV